MPYWFLPLTVALPDAVPPERGVPQDEIPESHVLLECRYLLAELAEILERHAAESQRTKQLA